MWFALSMIALFVAYCWYDSFSAALLAGAEWSNESDDEATVLSELREMLDEPLKCSTERAVTWHEMGFMTSDHVL